MVLRTFVILVVLAWVTYTLCNSEKYTLLRVYISPPAVSGRKYTPVTVYTSSCNSGIVNEAGPFDPL